MTSLLELVVRNFVIQFGKCEEILHCILSSPPLGEVWRYEVRRYEGMLLETIFNGIMCVISEALSGVGWRLCFGSVWDSKASREMSVN